MSQLHHEWPSEMSIEIYCGGMPPDAEPRSVATWWHAVTLFDGTPVELSCIDCDAASARCRDLGVENFPTTRVLIAGEEIARTSQVFPSSAALAKWIRALLRDSRPVDELVHEAQHIFP